MQPTAVASPRVMQSQPYKSYAHHAVQVGEAAEIKMTDYKLIERDRNDHEIIVVTVDGKIVFRGDYMSASDFVRREMVPGDTYQEGSLSILSYDQMVVEWQEDDRWELEASSARIPSGDVCVSWEGAGWYAPQQRGAHESQHVAWRFVGDSDEPESVGGKFDPWGTPSWFNSREEIEGVPPAKGKGK